MRIKNLYRIFLPIAIISLFAFANSCSKDEPFSNIKSSKRIEKNGKPEVPKDTLIDKKTDSTQYVIVLIIDGPRYADTWEAAGTPLIPYRKTLSKLGCLSTSFYNNGVTTTVPGHTAICTGVYQTINNGGAEIPDYPSFMQVWRKTFNQPANKAWIVASKDKLEVLSNCTNIKWKDNYRPMTDCGISGLNTGYRDDLTTLNKVQTILQTEEPGLMLINFKQPDAAGHSGDSLDYLQGIFDTDNYVNIIWNFIQNNDHYKNKTALIVTNDHGRHTAGHLDGFVSHGDDCAGCRHIEFLGLGPDFKENYISTTAYSQIDIAPTIAYLLGFKMPFGNGKVMKDLLEE
jgi:hypothetical protein